jgi:hypothetical protein
MLQFDCPHCGKAIRLKEEFAGRKGSCPHCRNSIQAPSSAPPPPPPPRAARPARPPAPPPRPAPEPDIEPEYFDDDAESAVEEPVIVRHDKKKSKKSNPMPLIIGGGAIGGVVLIGLVIWLTMNPKPSGTNPPPIPVAQAPGASGPATSPPPASGAGSPSPGTSAPAPGNPPATGQSPPASGSRSDLFAYLPPGLNSMAGARVTEALSAEDKALAKAQLESTLRPAFAKTGLKLDAIEEIVLGSGATADQLLVAIRATQPVDAASIRKSLGCTAGPQRLNQFDAYPLPPEPDAAESVAVFMDSKTLLLGSKAMVQQSLESASGAAQPSVLKDVTAVAGAKTHLWVVAPMGMLKSQVFQLVGWGVQESLFVSSLDKIGLVAMAYDLTTGMRLRMALECKSDGEAKLIRGVVDSMRVALREAEKKAASMPGGDSSPGGGSAGGAPPGGAGGPPQGGPGGMQGGPGSPPGRPGGPQGSGGPQGGMRGGPGGMQSGPGGMQGGPGGQRSGGPGGSGGTGGQGGMPGGGGGNLDRSPGAIWDATEVKQSGSHVLVTFPPMKMLGESLASPLDLFGSATQAGIVRSSVGTPLFPGSLRRTSQALRALEQQDGAIPPGAVSLNAEKNPRPVQRVSWLATLLPYLGYQELHDQISFADEWTDKKNIPIAATIVDAFLDPLVPQRRWKGYPLDGVALTHYVGMGGVGAEAPRLPKEHPKAGIFGYDRKTALEDVRDGTSNTIMMIQVRDVFGPWIEGGGATVRAAQSQPYIGSTSGFGSPGDQGVMAIFADGSVRFIKKDIDPKIFEALCTMNGGESVDLSQLGAPGNANAGPSIAANRPMAPPSAPPAKAAAPPESPAPGVGSAPTKDPASKGTPAGAGLTRYEMKETGFAITLPSDWKTVDPAKLEDELKTIAQQNLQLAAIIEPTARAAAQFGAKFFALDAQSISGGVPISVNVIKQEQPTPIPLDACVAQNIQLIETIPVAIKPINHQRVHLTSGDAERLDYGLNLPLLNGATVKVAIVQYLVVKDRVAFAITLSAAAESASQHLPTFEKIANSFQFVE